MGALIALPIYIDDDEGKDMVAVEDMAHLREDFSDECCVTRRRV